jgi:hypothetical protein
MQVARRPCGPPQGFVRTDGKTAWVSGPGGVAHRLLWPGMMDVIALGLTLGFFALSMGLIALCDRL